MLTRLSAAALRRPGLTALLIGAASATGFAPLGLWPITLIALALLLWLLEHSNTHRAAFALGWLFGLGHFTVGLNWIATAFTFQAKMPAWIGMLAVPLLSLYLAIFIGLATWAAWAVWRRLCPRPKSDHPEQGSSRAMPRSLASGKGREKGPSREPVSRDARLPLALLFAATWIVAEWLRSWVFTGFAWNPLAVVWFANALGINGIGHLAVWTGTYALSGLTILIAGVVREYPARAAKHRWNRQTAGVTAILLISLVALPSILGFSWAASSTTGTPITLVQPNIDQGDKWDMAARAENFRKLALLSPRTENQPPRLLLWPEAAVPDYLEGGYPLDWYVEAPGFTRAKLAGLLGPDDVMLTGAVKLDPLPDRSNISGARNSVFSLDARGTLGPRYDKSHLVPYGEYLPARSILSLIGVERLAPGAIDFRHGPGPRSLDLGRFGTVGVQICYEIIFSGQVVDRADRPDFIFNPSNDAWFGSWGPPQHLAQARLRAIEEGLPVIRSTPTGISAIIDADGRILDSIPMHTAGRIDAFVPPAHAPTLFARYGNILPLAFAVFLGCLAIAFARRRR